MTDNPELSPKLTHAALRLAGARPENWLCPVCGAVLRDDLIADDFDGPPFHEHHGHPVELIPRAEL
jgi:hypothetical protein